MSQLADKSLPELKMAPAPRKARKWGFLDAGLVILLVLVVGHVVGGLLGEWPPTKALMMALRGDSQGASALFGGLIAAMQLRDWVLLAFLLSASVFVWLQSAAIARFFRSMHAGVMLITLATLAIFVGVLVPQIRSFEDPDERVNAANYEANYRDFAWAESYFLYHLLRPYGIGMPKAEVPPSVTEGLERFGSVYGEEERSNREKMIRASFASGPKTDEIEAWMRHYEGVLRKAFDVATFLQFNRAYKSDWFATLMFLVASAVLLNTFRPGMTGKWFTVNKIGFFVTHIGILVMLGGGFVSHLLTDRGILELHLGRGPEDVYFRHYRNDKRARMPFALELQHFARKEWKALEIYSLEEQFDTRPPRYTLWPGREIELDFKPDATTGELRPQLAVRVRELYDHAVVGDPRVYEGSPAPGEAALPVVAIDVPDVPQPDQPGHAAHVAPDGRRTAYLSPALRNQGFYDPHNRFRLAVVYETDAEQAFPDDQGTVVGTLDVEVRTDIRGAPIPVPARLGERIEIPGGYQIEVVDACADVDIEGGHRERVLAGSDDPRPLAEQPYDVAAVWVDIYPPDGGEVERRLVLERIDPIEYGLQDSYEHDDVIARLRWDRWSAPGPPRFVLSYGKDRPALLFDRDGGSTPVTVGQPLALPGETVVVPEGLLHHAVFEKNITFRPQVRGPDGWDASFYSRDPRGAVLEVVHHPGTEREHVESVTMSTSELGQANVWFTGDERFALVFLENAEGFPFDWRSVLSVWEVDADGRPYKVDAGSEKQREIRVNDYFKYRGYRFFQTNATPEDPTYSGIGVVYDPGIPIVLTGMYTIIAGTILAFILRPIVNARRRKEASA